MENMQADVGVDVNGCWHLCPILTNCHAGSVKIVFRSVSSSQTNKTAVGQSPVISGTKYVW